MVDDVHVDRHPLALGEQVGHEQRRDRGRRYHQSTSYRRYDSRRETKSSLRINRCRGLSTSELFDATAPVALRATRTALTEPNAPSGLRAASPSGTFPHT